MQPKARVIFRVDAAHHLGIGHLMRCFAFAEKLDKLDIKSVFVTKDFEKNVIALIQDNGYCVHAIPHKSSFEEDASCTLGFARQYSAKVIITDVSNSDTLQKIDAFKRYISVLKGNGKFLATIDGLEEGCINAKIRCPSDIVIIPYVGAEKRKYKTNRGTDYLLGPDYFIFRQEFIKTARVKREINRQACNILVTMGGSDPFGFTIKTVKALVKIDRPGLNLRIVIGPGFKISTRQKLEKILSGFKGRYKLLINNNHMAGLMLRADLAITNSGLTKYETAFMGTPSIIISYDHSQEKITEEFAKRGSSLHLGKGKDIQEANIADAVKKLLDDYELRREMSRKGRALVDGRGLERIIARIPKELISD